MIEIIHAECGITKDYQRQDPSDFSPPNSKSIRVIDLADLMTEIAAGNTLAGFLIMDGNPTKYILLDMHQ